MLIKLIRLIKSKRQVKQNKRELFKKMNLNVEHLTFISSNSSEPIQETLVFHKINESIFKNTYDLNLTRGLRNTNLNVKKSGKYTHCLKTFHQKNPSFLNKIKFFKLSLISFYLYSFSSSCFAKDILKEQAADAIDTFKGTVLTLIIIAEIIGAYSYWHKSRDLKGTITGLFFVLLLTGWASTKV